MAALREARLLGAAIPRELGGEGASFASIVAVCHELGKACSSTAMVFAMHQIQVACLIVHGERSTWHRRFLQRVASEQLLLASATTEGSSGGDVRRSECTVMLEGGSARVEKSGCIISYAEHADAILTTARRDPDSAASDQVLVVAERGQCRLQQTSRWDTLGMRGTCSAGYSLTMKVDPVQVLPTPYADISATTMLPVSHITWAGLWLGIAAEACNRARAAVRRRAVPGAPGLVPGSSRLADAWMQLQGLRAQVADAVARYTAALHDSDALSSIPFALTMNQLKLAVSTGAIQVVGQAMLAAGLSAYRNDSPHSMGRLLRDVHSAPLMIGNDRILANCAAMLPALRGEESLYP